MRQPHICARCGSEDSVVKHRSDLIDYKGLTLEVHGLAETVCKHCDHKWSTEGQQLDNLALVRAAYVAKRDAVRVTEGLLTGAEIADILSALRMTRADAAQIFGGGPNAFGKYVSGEVLQSTAMDRLMRMTYWFGTEAVEFLRVEAKKPLTQRPVAAAVFDTVCVVWPGGHLMGTNQGAPRVEVVGYGAPAGLRIQ